MHQPRAIADEEGVRLIDGEVPHGARGDDDFQRLDRAGGAIRLRDRVAEDQAT